MTGKSIAPARVLADGVLGGLSVAVDPSGVALGRDGAGAAVLVRLFGAEPLSVTFVGGWWAAQILAHRCLAHGATVVVDAVDTATPAEQGTMAGLSQWLALDRTTGGGRVRPMAGDPTPNWPASATQPLLRLHDVGPAGPAAGSPLLGWHTQLTVLSRLTPASLTTMAGAELVLTQRLEPPEADLVGSALLLGPDFVERVSAMDNDMVAAFRGPTVRYARLNATAIERQLFG